MRCIETDILVIGSGIAGLFYAIQCAEFARVLLVSKSSIGESNTMYAQGGISSVSAEQDSIEFHVRDTLIAGDGLCNEDAVRLVASQAAHCISELESMSVRFDRDASGQFDLHREGGHSHSRVLHSKDATGREVENSLVRHVRSLPNITVLERHFVVDFNLASHTCTGAFAFDIDTQSFCNLSSRVTMLATGGGAQVYLRNTNPPVSTGDGYALAQRAGAIMQNMEFVQFHPTTLVSPTPQTYLISEAVRGFGARLKLKNGEEFMQKYHPMASLAPRDIVSRAIDMEMKQRHEDCVYLDMRSFARDDILSHFPNIFRRCQEEGLDLSHDMIPVVPAAHYFCGGVHTDLHARTNISKLYACGEVACTGVHGANRLASNSLLEGLVFAEQASLDTKMCFSTTPRIESTLRTPTSLDTSPKDAFLDMRHELQRSMWSHAGIVRSEIGLSIGLQQLLSIEHRVHTLIQDRGFSVEAMEVLNMAEVGKLILAAAQQRRASVGCHWREDSIA